MGMLLKNLLERLFEISLESFLCEKIPQNDSIEISKKNCLRKVAWKVLLEIKKKIFLVWGGPKVFEKFYGNS